MGPSSDRISKISSIIRKKIALEIFILLSCNPRLYVSQISRMLNKPKSTVSRNLRKMERAGILTSEDEGRLYYEIPENLGLHLKPLLEKSIPEDPEEKRMYFKEALDRINTLIYLLKNSFRFIDPVLKKLNHAFENRSKMFEAIFREFFRGKDKKVDLQAMVIPEENLEAFQRLNAEYTEKVKKLMKNSTINQQEETNENIEENFLFFSTLLPLNILFK